MSSHVNVTIEIPALGIQPLDLRIPTEQQVGELIRNILETLHINVTIDNYYLYIPTKKAVLLSNQMLHEANVTNGDILQIM